MTKAMFREEVLNVYLARLLDQRGLVSAPETVRSGPAGSTRLRDVVVTFRGLRLLIEGKVDDVPDARNVVAGQAQERVDEGLAHIAIGIVYPAVLRGVPFRALDATMATAPLEIQVHTESGAGPWVRVSNVNGLVEQLVRTYEQLVTENVVADAVAIIEAGIDVFAREVRSSPAGADRITDLLEVGEPPTAAENA